MSKPPKPTRQLKSGKQVPNLAATAGGALRKYGNPELIKIAIEAWLSDVEAGLAQAGRYTRVRDAIRSQVNCSHDAAEDAIRGARAYQADFFAAELPFRVAEISAQLQRIADANEESNAIAAVAALREIGKMNGLYAPKKVEVEHTAGPSPQVQLQAMLDVLSPEGRTGLELALSEFEAAKASGRLTLATGDEAEDAVLVGDGEAN